MSHHERLHMRQLQRFPEQRIVVKINLPDREIVCGSPIGIYPCEQLARQWTMCLGNLRLVACRFSGGGTRGNRFRWIFENTFDHFCRPPGACPEHQFYTRDSARRLPGGCSFNVAEKTSNSRQMRTTEALPALPSLAPAATAERWRLAAEDTRQKAVLTL